MTDDEAAAAREDVIESIERSAEIYGLSRSAGRVYGVLYFADRPLSIADLVEETGYAKSTISNVTRKLTRLGLVHRRSSEGGGRRVRFAPETDLWFVVQDVLQQYVDREMEMTQRTLDRALEDVDQLETAESASVRDDIEALSATYTQLQALLRLATRHSPEELLSAVQQAEDK
ncbi:GbsR/MarR family transcriptional regulator [Salinigranum halophilum]|jgi:DNA-binding transcriptional regulator GbsR (MarR family)|uniref:GbsR/MarR family transcriptional regulator n=1 Tax=Salinigranum halophilum TaxID=2565931 RepID=UPI00115E4DE7|nr:MarR family transcriptional regulator [Salinigranum halophilum]